MMEISYVDIICKSTLATNTPMMAVANSGPEDPAAMSVAPATSGGRFNTANEKL